MAKLTIEDLINKKEMLKEQSKVKTCLIHCKKLGGELEAHSLSKGDLADVRAKMDKDAIAGTYKLIYMSIDDLRNSQLLEAFGCKTESEKIVGRLFPHENELVAVGNIIKNLNGLGYLKADEIYVKELEDLKN